MPLHLKCDTMCLLVETSVESIYMCYKDLDKRFAVVHGKDYSDMCQGNSIIQSDIAFQSGDI